MVKIGAPRRLLASLFGARRGGDRAGWSTDVPDHLVELLFLRAVWGIEVPGGPPACAPPPQTKRPLPAGFSPERATASWRDLWDEGVAWRADGFPPTTFPPYWRERFGPTGVEDERRGWVNPRRAELAALAAGVIERPRAWDLIMNPPDQDQPTIVVLPLADPWVSWVSQRQVMMSGQVLADDDLLAQALTAPR